jgi:hypothetical protein
MQPHLRSHLHHVRAAILPFVCASLTLVGAAFPQGSPSEPPRASTRSSTPEVRRAADDLQALARAQQILLERGYLSESVRLEAIYRELEAGARVQSVEARAQALLAKDIHDRAVRVDILELATEGYAAAGWETNAEALGWFAAIGTSQRDGGTTPMPPMNPIPAGARADSGTVMDRMIELVLGAGAVHQQRGNPTAAQCCLRLGRFYVQRELGAFRTAGSPEDADSEEPVVEPLKGLGYVDGADAVKELPATLPPAAARPVEETSAKPPVDVARPLSPVEAERLELQRQIQRVRARVEELQRELARDPSPPAPGGGASGR